MRMQRSNRVSRRMVALVFAALCVVATPPVLAFAPDGACCLPDDSCAVLLDFQCDEAGGTFVDVGTTCETVTCGAHMVPAVSGAVLIVIAAILGATGFVTLRRRAAR